ncbi:uncharacterized protein CDAR_512431 [Caerostris darwini]|uniref:Uncharacterized protein n=1 Tax=Caerostris darwini TaxID=1538125 RepID=A0AAV4RFV1_9ARAC|nr:uncharacterized protein CDAR_512431 [Caerostris darwini]
MKCPAKIKLCLCQDCKCPDRCNNCSKPDIYDNVSEESYGMFDLLAHNIPPPLSKGKKSKTNSQGRLVTTYGEEFRWKRISSPVKITKPFPCILIPNQKMSNETNNSKDYQPSKMTDQIDCRGKIVKHKNNITCSNDKFEGKSETKSAYKFPVPKKVFGLNGDSAKGLQMLRPVTKQSSAKFPSSSSTTYKSSYKTMKNIQKTESCKPKPSVPQKESPFKHTTQYQNDYKRLIRQTKREKKKSPVYRPPSVPMEKATCYRTEFYYKIPVEQKRTIWDPNHRIYKITAEKCECPCTGLANDEKNNICNRIKCGEDICCSMGKENCAPLPVTQDTVKIKQ